MKNKKLWITLGVVLAVVIVVICVLAYIFRLKTVDIEFRSRVSENTRLEEGIKDEVLKDGEFEYGKNILFMNVEKNVAKIEKAHPFVKVEQVIRYFPNILRVYISERLPKFRVRDKNDTNLWYILDDEFKVLDTTTSEQLSGDADYFVNTFEVSAETLTISAEKGDFIQNNDKIKNYLNVISSAIYAIDNTFSTIKSISISEGNFTVTMLHLNCQLIVSGEEDLFEKFVAATRYFRDENNQSEITDGTQIQVEKSGNGYIGKKI